MISWAEMKRFLCCVLKGPIFISSRNRTSIPILEEKSIKSNLYQYIAFLNDHIQKEDSAIYQVAESLNEKVQGGDAEMLPKFEQMAARYRETMREALEFEKSLVEESPRWLPPTP